MASYNVRAPIAGSPLDYARGIRGLLPASAQSSVFRQAGATRIKIVVRETNELLPGRMAAKIELSLRCEFSFQSRAGSREGIGLIFSEMRNFMEQHRSGDIDTWVSFAEKCRSTTSQSIQITSVRMIG